MLTWVSTLMFVGQAGLINFIQPEVRTGEIAQTQAGEAHLGDGTHYQQVIEGSGPRHEAVIGEGGVGLVDHHQPRCLFDHPQQRILRKQVAGGVVGIGEEDQRRLVLLDGFEQTVEIESETLRVEGDPHILHAAEGGDHDLINRVGPSYHIDII